MKKEITLKALDTNKFIEEQVNAIRSLVGDGVAINALSGGVDSSTVTMLGHRALGRRLRTVFIQNGLMRQDEAESVVSIFSGLGVNVEIVDAKNEFPHLPRDRRILIQQIQPHPAA